MLIIKKRKVSQKVGFDLIGNKIFSFSVFLFINYYYKKTYVKCKMLNNPCKVTPFAINFVLLTPVV